MSLNGFWTSFAFLRWHIIDATSAVLRLIAWGFELRDRAIPIFLMLTVIGAID